MILCRPPLAPYGKCSTVVEHSRICDTPPEISVVPTLIVGKREISMTSLAFDTHASVKKLKEAGFTEQQAEAQVQVLAGIIESSLATKLDIAEVKRDIERLGAELKHDLGSTEAALRRDIELLRAEIKRDLAETKGEIIRWMAGLIIGAVVALTGIFATIVKLMLP